MDDDIILPFQKEIKISKTVNYLRIHYVIFIKVRLKYFEIHLKDKMILETHGFGSEKAFIENTVFSKESIKECKYFTSNEEPSYKEFTEILIKIIEKINDKNEKILLQSVLTYKKVKDYVWEGDYLNKIWYNLFRSVRK